jgi:outer membrane protein assembly factor BamB
MDFKKQDTDWRSFRDGQHNPGARDTDITAPLKLLWKKKIGPGYSTSLILDQMVITGSVERKIAFLKLGSGDKIDSYSLSFPISVTPCADESILYFSEGKASSALSALNLKSGNLIWEKKFRGTGSSPVISGNMLFIGTDSSLFCLDKMKGEIIWKFETGGNVYSTPAFSDDALYFGSTDRKIYCLEKSSGKPDWCYETQGAVYASPCIGDESLFWGSTDGYFYALGLVQGEFLWKYKSGGSIYSSAARDKGKVFFGSNDGCLYALFTEDGSLAWKFETDGPIRSSPIIAGEMLFFGSLDGNFYGLNSSNGEMVFKYESGGMLYASPSFSQGKVLISSTDGYLYCFGKGGKKDGK